MFSKIRQRRIDRKHKEFLWQQEQRMEAANATARLAVHSTIHALTAQISLDQLKKMIRNAEKNQEKYTTLGKLWAKHLQKVDPRRFR